MLKITQQNLAWKFGVNLVVGVFLMLAGFGSVLAETADLSNTVLPGISRGEATDLTVKFLQLEKKNADFLGKCKLDAGACLFAFSSRTNFQILLKPVILYPDVFPAYRYYKSINMASELDLVRGYFEEDNSPFRPEQSITKVEALKLVLGATNVVNWKEKFEISANMGDTTRDIPGNWMMFGLDTNKWWYGRYLAAAEANGFWHPSSREASKDKSVSAVEAERGISKEDFLKLLDGANKIVAGRQASSANMTF